MPQDFDFSGIAKAEQPPSYSFAGIEKVKQPADKGTIIYTNKPTTNAAVEMSGTAALIPAATRASTELATNPSVPKVAASIGRFAGAVGPTVAAMAEGSPVGTLAAIGASGKTAWAGGKAGWFTGRLMQNASAPIANALMKVAPYVQTLSTLSGAQGIGDLAQMVDPTRQDIGFLGIGHTVNVPGAHPALINMLLGKISEAVTHLTNAGLEKADALAAVLGTAKPQQASR